MFSKISKIDIEELKKQEEEEKVSSPYTKVGKTKLILNADEEHFLYNINLVVEKETIPEKIDKMTIKVPITGSKVKAWILIVGGILLGIVGICVYMLIKRKK